MEVARQAAVSKGEAAIVASMNSVYFAACNNLANVVVPRLNDLMLSMGVKQLDELKVDSHTNYKHSDSIIDLQSAISYVIESDMLNRLNSGCRKFSLMFDESTDISVHQNLIVYVRFLESDALDYFSPKTYFLSIDSLARADAQSIFDKVLGILSSKGISLDGLCGVCTDGAAVMTGHRSGVVTRLKAAVPGVLATHCIAHRLALSCCSGADCIPYLVKVQEILNSVFKYFNKSPKNMAMLESIQSISGGCSSRFKEVFHTRWLSFEGSVDAFVRNFSSLVSVFLQENSGKSLCLHKPITCYKFLYVAHFLCDVLKPLSILSKLYQQSNLDFSEVTPHLTSTISTLEERKDKKNGSRLSNFLSVVPSEPQVDSSGLCTFQFQGHTMRDSAKQRTEAVAVCDKFVDGMVRSLNSRFSDNEDSSILSSLSNLFNPSISASLKSDDLDVISDYLGTVGFQGYRDQISDFASYLGELVASGSKTVTNSRDAANLAIRKSEIYPAVAEAGQRFLVEPVSTVDCERGFSKQNLIKSCLRNSLSTSSLENLIRISVDGPSGSEFNFHKAFVRWSGAKDRRILH